VALDALLALDFTPLFSIGFVCSLLCTIFFITFFSSETCCSGFSITFFSCGSSESFASFCS